MIKRAIPLLIHGANQTGLSSSFITSTNEDCDSEENPTKNARDLNSPIAHWVPELNPLLWIVITIFWCIAYAVPLVALFWRTKHNFYYGATFYYTVNIASCFCWVAQTTLSAYWFWNNLGLSRALELVISLYFVVDVLLIVCLRDTSNLSNMDIILDYGVSLLAYVWALELGVQSYLEMRTTQQETQESLVETVNQSDTQLIPVHEEPFSSYHAIECIEDGGLVK